LPETLLTYYLTNTCSSCTGGVWRTLGRHSQSTVYMFTQLSPHAG